MLLGGGARKGPRAARARDALRACQRHLGHLPAGGARRKNPMINFKNPTPLSFLGYITWRRRSAGRRCWRRATCSARSRCTARWPAASGSPSSGRRLPRRTCRPAWRTCTSRACTRARSSSSRAPSAVRVLTLGLVSMPLFKFVQSSPGASEPGRVYARGLVVPARPPSALCAPLPSQTL